KPRRAFRTRCSTGYRGRWFLPAAAYLYGEGVPGFLCRYDQAWYYREPSRATKGTDEIGYGPWTALEKIPLADRNRPVQQLLTDLDR
ncbi:hypothetical protein AB6846_01800, partial [Serratia proteamaculans]